MRLLALSLVLTTVGCASPKFYNPDLPYDEQVRQFPSVRGQCLQAAYSVQSPGFNYAQAQASQFRANASAYGANAYASPTPADSLTAGIANGMQIRAARDTRQAQQQIFEGCMAENGWYRSQ